MKAIDRFCYKHPKLGIPDLMKYIVLANVAVFVMDLFMNSSNVSQFWAFSLK